MADRFAFDGPVVVVPAREAALIWAWCQSGGRDLEELRQSAWKRDGDLFEVLLALRMAALRVGPAVPVAVPGSGTGRNLVEDEPVVGAVGSAGAADLAGVSVRAVRKAALAGRLPGERVDGRWLFSVAAVEAWMATRAA